MSNYVYLTDPKSCPQCRARFENQLRWNCPNCGVKLFGSTTYDFVRFEEETPIRVWWAFHKLDGWKFRDFYMIEDAKPNHRHYEPPKLDKDYGREMTPYMVQRRGGKTAAFGKKRVKVLNKKRRR